MWANRRNVTGSEGGYTRLRRLKSLVVLFVVVRISAVLKACYIDGIFQSKFRSKDNNVLSYYYSFECRCLSSSCSSEMFKKTKTTMNTSSDFYRRRRSHLSSTKTEFLFHRKLVHFGAISFKLVIFSFYAYEPS